MTDLDYTENLRLRQQLADATQRAETLEELAEKRRYRAKEAEHERDAARARVAELEALFSDLPRIEEFGDGEVRHLEVDTTAYSRWLRRIDAALASPDAKRDELRQALPLSSLERDAAEAMSQPNTERPKDSAVDVERAIAFLRARGAPAHADVVHRLRMSEDAATVQCIGMASIITQLRERAEAAEKQIQADIRMLDKRDARIAQLEAQLTKLDEGERRTWFEFDMLDDAQGDADAWQRSEDSYNTEAEARKNAEAYTAQWGNKTRPVQVTEIRRVLSGAGEEGSKP